MYQFFVNEPISVGDKITLSKEQSHHALTVLRLHHETVRVVYEGKAYFGDGHCENKNFVVEVFEQDNRVTELPCNVTLMMALIRKEKMEFVLQKCTELGIAKIVPFNSSRTVVHYDKDKSRKVLDRWNLILEESSAQCKRNIIPQLTDIVSIKDLVKYKEEQNFIAYENAESENNVFGQNIEKSSICYCIGPEGGFSEEEADFLVSNGFKMTSFGNRILRAETAAIYGMSILSNELEK